MELQTAIKNTIEFEVRQAREKVSWAKDLTAVLSLVPAGIDVKYIISSPGPRYIGLYVDGNATQVADIITQMTGAHFIGKDIFTGAVLVAKDASGIRWEIYDHPGMKGPEVNDELVEFRFNPDRTYCPAPRLPDGPTDLLLG